MMTPYLPRFSIVIPTYRRHERLATALEAVRALDYPRDRFEVIVVDDGSRTPPRALVARHRTGCDVVLLTPRHGGPAAARNVGAARARGQFLAFTDDDCEPAPDWLRALAARFARAPECAVGGRTINALGGNLYSTASQLLLSYLYTYYNADPEHSRFFATMNFALPIERFRALGGFDTSYPLAAAEDRDLCCRWVRRGYRMTYAPEAVVHHAHPLTFRSFWRQHLNYGRGAYRFHHRCGASAQGGVKVEPASFYLNLLRYPFAEAQGLRSPALAGLLALSQVANAAGFLGEWRRRN